MNRKLRWALTFVVAAVLWSVVAPTLARILVVRRGPSNAAAMMLLSGSSAQQERVRQTIRVFQEGRSGMVILTDDGTMGPWSRRYQRRLAPIERTRDSLIAGGVPEARIISLPGKVHSTYDEAVAVRAYAREHRLPSLLVVTSAYHSRRALWVFERALGGEGVSVGIDPAPTGDASPSAESWWLTLRGWRSVALEYPKLAYYFLMHR